MSNRSTVLRSCTSSDVYVSNDYYLYNSASGELYSIYMSCCVFVGIKSGTQV